MHWLLPHHHVRTLKETTQRIQHQGVLGSCFSCLYPVTTSLHFPPSSLPGRKYLEHVYSFTVSSYTCFTDASLEWMFWFFLGVFFHLHHLLHLKISIVFAFLAINHLIVIYISLNSKPEPIKPLTIFLIPSLPPPLACLLASPNRVSVAHTFLSTFFPLYFFPWWTY